MKKILILIAIIFSCNRSSACDICGCGIGNNYIGILPDFTNNILGLRYRYNNLRTHVGINGAFTHLTTKETYSTAELWGAKNITKKIRLMFSLPYNIIEKQKEKSTAEKMGIGDMSLSGFYQLLNKRKAIPNEKLLIHTLWVGAVVKLPTGQYEMQNNTANDANIFQLGTGSTDVSFNAMYDIRIQDVGLNINSSYKVNSPNKERYQYGNKFSLNTQLYHKFRLNKKWQLSPNAGLQYEVAQKDINAGYKADISGGNILLGTIAVEAMYKNIMAGANWQTPLQQKLAGNMVHANNRAMLHVACVF